MGCGQVQLVPVGQQRPLQTLLEHSAFVAHVCPSGQRQPYAPLLAVQVLPPVQVVLQAPQFGELSSDLH